MVTLDRHWESWSPWSVCSTTCVSSAAMPSQRQRSRSCSPKVWPPGINTCQTNQENETENCTVPQCPGITRRQKAFCTMHVIFFRDIFLFTINSWNITIYTHFLVPNKLSELNNQLDFFLSTSVNGGWSAWDTGSACSVTCGNGTLTRNRNCTNPAPAHGGQNCSNGPSVEIVACPLVLCPGISNLEISIVWFNCNLIQAKTKLLVLVWANFDWFYYKVCIVATIGQ